MTELILGGWDSLKTKFSGGLVHVIGFHKPLVLILFLKFGHRSYITAVSTQTVTIPRTRPRRTPFNKPVIGLFLGCSSLPVFWLVKMTASVVAVSELVLLTATVNTSNTRFLS